MDDQNLNNQNKQPVQDQPVQPQPVAEPISVGQKEQEPIVASPKTSEYLASSETQPELSKEVKEAGVEEISEKVSLTQDQQAAGVRHAGPTVEPKTEPEGKVKLPLTEEEVQRVEKKEKPSNSIKWLAAIIKKAWKSASWRIKGENK
jgi:hypothetical protein